MRGRRGGERGRNRRIGHAWILQTYNLVHGLWMTFVGGSNQPTNHQPTNHTIQNLMRAVRPTNGIAPSHTYLDNEDATCLESWAL